MSTPKHTFNVARLLLGAACVITSVSCGGELLRTGRSASFLVVSNISGGSGALFSEVLQSDVQRLVEEQVGGVTVKVPTIFSDSVRVGLRADVKNPAIVPTLLNAVTVTRYRVNFRRSDGRNTPGVDVPYGFDGAVSATIQVGETFNVIIELVRHQAKLEPPLRNLVGLGGLGFISAIAEITFYGHDQNGTELSTTAQMDVQFGDFADGL